MSRLTRVEKDREAKAQTATPLSQRLGSLLGELGVDRVHFAAATIDDADSIAELHPRSVATLTLLGRGSVALDKLDRFDGRITIVCTDREAGGMSSANTALALRTRRVLLPGYEWFLWSDVAVDHGEAIMGALTEAAAVDGGIPEMDAASLETEGEIKGITYRLSGQGPPLVLLPIALAPSQWKPIVGRLAERFCVVEVGGPFVGTTAMLEGRARSAGHTAMLDWLIDGLRPGPGQSFLEVGCGTAAATRLIARRSAGVRLVATDINPYLCDVARQLADAEGIGSRVELVESNAEELPFADASFDAAFSVTVLEECRADVALREMARVTKPGGRIGVIVRATDLTRVTSIEGSDRLRDALKWVPTAGSAQGGCADASLYRRMANLALGDLRVLPQIVAYDASEPALLHHLSRLVTALLPDGLREEYTRAATAARERGIFFVGLPYHCCIGVKTR